MTATKRARLARDNSEHLRRLLSARHPEFLAMLQAAERLVDHELSRTDGDRHAQRGPEKR